MILAIRKPIARFMRYAFGRQYVFVLTTNGKTKLRRVFTSDWNSDEYIHNDDLSPFGFDRIRLKDARDLAFRDWKPATFTEAERKAKAVMDAMTDAPITTSKQANAAAQVGSAPRMSPADFAAFQAAFAMAQQKAKIQRP